MTEERKSQKNLRYVASNFQVWNKENKENEPSNIIEGVFINEVTTFDEEGKEENKFLQVDVKTKDNRTHSAFLNSPKSETEKKLLSKISKLSNEQKEKLLEKLN